MLYSASNFIQIKELPKALIDGFFLKSKSFLRKRKSSKKLFRILNIFILMSSLDIT